MNDASPSLIKRLTTRTAILAFVAGAVTATGLGALAASETVVSLHHGMHAGMTQAGMQAHIDGALAHIYRVTQATDAQKVVIEPIVRQAFTDMWPVHAQFAGAHQQLLTLLSQSTIDRAAIETLRVQEMQQVDQTSKRFLQMVADVGDALTPAQRQQLAERIKQLHVQPG